MTNRVRASDPSRIVFHATLVLLAAVMLFLAGVFVATSRPEPYRTIERHLKLLNDAIEVGGFAPKHALHRAPAAASRAAWNARARDAIVPGYRVLTGYMPDHDAFGIWIFDADGHRVHERVLDYDSLDPDGPSGGSESPHALHVLRDGSVIVNVDKGDAIARYDVCGQPVWSREGAFHHSLFEDPEGGLWTWQGETNTFDQYQWLVRFDPETGEFIERVSLVDDIIEQSSASRQIFSVAAGQSLVRRQSAGAVRDLFHPNDVEVLSEALADAFDEFDPGDFLLSFRNLDLVVVVDRQNHAILWWSHGPWHRQHDPDFLPDGTISVFDNDTGHGTSAIMTIDPESRELGLVDIEPDYRFYSRFMGKHTWLDETTVQIVVPYEGRVLEVDRDGRVLLEINNVRDAIYNGLVSDAAWLPLDFFVTSPSDFDCPP